MRRVPVYISVIIRIAARVTGTEPSLDGTLLLLSEDESRLDIRIDM
jgi:hypothetical protein